MTTLGPLMSGLRALRDRTGDYKSGEDFFADIDRLKALDPNLPEKELDELRQLGLRCVRVGLRIWIWGRCLALAGRTVLVVAAAIAAVATSIWILGGFSTPDHQRRARAQGLRDLHPRDASRSAWSILHHHDSG